MEKINEKNLEKALGNLSEGNEGQESPKMSKEAEVGFHQGALNTLVNERNELIKVIKNVEAIMQAHIKRLEELGVKINRKE